MFVGIFVITYCFEGRNLALMYLALIIAYIERVLGDWSVLRITHLLFITDVQNAGCALC